MYSRAIEWSNFWDAYHEILKDIPTSEKEILNSFYKEIADLIKQAKPKLAKHEMNEEELQILRMIAHIRSLGISVNEIASKDREAGNLFWQVSDTWYPLILHLLRKLVRLKYSNEKSCKKEN
jgi:hypothetical protein